MKITIFTLGTRGDVQPFAVLGQALAKNGHEVTLSTAKNFESLVKGFDLNFHPVDTDYEELLNSEEGRKILQVNLFAIQRNLHKLIFPLIKHSLNEFYQLARCSDLIIYRPKTFVDAFVNQLPVKAVRAAVIPAVEETAAFFNPMYTALRLPDFMNRWSYKLNSLRFRFFRKPLEQFYLQNGLQETRQTKSEVPFIYGISPQFLDKPADWPENNHLTGFWLPSAGNCPIDQDLLDFIAAGPPPLLLTFGSMPIKEKIKSLIIQAVKATGKRYIIVKGWADWNTDELDNSYRYKIISAAPFSELLPRVKAVIHHGGLGTTAECLRAGKPMLICPVMYPVGDQNFWADLAYKKGFAVKPVPLVKLTAESLAGKIRELTACTELYTNCAAMAEKLQQENGLKKAVSIIERILKGDNMQDTFLPETG